MEVADAEEDRFHYVGAGHVAGFGLAKDIVFATDATWPPMEFVNADKQIVGYSIDYMTAAGKEAGFTAVFKAVALDGIFAGLAGSVRRHLLPQFRSPRNARKRWTSAPPTSSSPALVVKKDSPSSLWKNPGQEGRLPDQHHRHLCRAEGGRRGIQDYDEVGLAIEDLFNGRIDGVVCDDPVAADYALNNEKYKEALKIAAVIESDEPSIYGIAVNKATMEVLDLVNAGIKAVQEKGLDKELLKKWMGH
jgi:polar amino acid transport system substrate-binding protein